MLLEIPDLGEKDALFNFIDGLKPWAQQELKCRGVQTLQQAMTVIETLVKFKRKMPPSKSKVYGKGSGDKDRSYKSHDKGKSKISKKSGEKLKGKLNCYFCGEPHMLRDCLERSKLVAMMEEKESLDRDAIMLRAL